MSEKGKIVFSDTFEEGLDNWVIEKWEEDKISAEHKDGMMHVTTHDTTNGVMIWCKKELPASFLFEFDMTPHSPSGFFLVFFCAKGRNGEDITSKEMLAQKSAKTLFKKYTKGTIDCYHTSYRRNEVADCNLRKNSGLILLKKKQVDEVLPRDQTHHVQLLKKGGQIKLTVNGRLFMDYTDDGKTNGPIWEGGRIGLRQVYDSDGSYDNVKITDLE